MQDQEQAPDRVILALAGQHTISIDPSPEGQWVRFVTSEGATPIVVEVTPRGITLKLDAPAITLQAAGTLSLLADKLVLGGEQGVEIASGGALALLAAGELSSVAGAQRIVAERGCVGVKASDDVKLSGERVRVNCDETNDRWFRSQPSLPPTPEPSPTNEAD